MISASACRRVVADQLDPGLGELALRLHLGATHQQHRAGIGKAQRARRIGQAAGGETADLRRGVRPQPHHALALRVHQPEGLLRRGGAGPGEERILELQQRRGDALIAVGSEAIHDRLGGTRLPFSLRRQHIGQAGGEKSGVCGRRLVHQEPVRAGS